VRKGKGEENFCRAGEKRIFKTPRGGDAGEFGRIVSFWANFFLEGKGKRENPVDPWSRRERKSQLTRGNSRRVVQERGSVLRGGSSRGFIYQRGNDRSIGKEAPRGERAGALRSEPGWKEALKSWKSTLREAQLLSGEALLERKDLSRRKGEEGGFFQSGTLRRARNWIILRRSRDLFEKKIESS